MKDKEKLILGNSGDKMKDKEKLILNFLKKDGRSSTTRIASAIKSDIWITRKYLESLEEKKKIICEKETKATYWRLNEKT